MPASVLNTNLGSMIARRNLAGAQTRLAESVERLSSGLRINRAKDDAAGMAVSSVIEGQTRVAATAHRNVNDAMSMVHTAEGALQEATSMLTRIKELATQGANDSMSRDQYYFLVQEMRQIMEELINTADRTSFNGNKLLGGSPNATRQVTSTSTTTQTTGVAPNTWTAVDSSGLLTGMTGTIRVIAEVTGGTVKVDTVPAGVNATITGYGNATDGSATSIAFEGSVADVTTALAGLKAQRTGTGDAQVALNSIPALPANMAYNPQNGHYYELVQVPAEISFIDAKQAADNKRWNGLVGYLATITSSMENALVSTVAGDLAWIGGSDAQEFGTSEGEWVWVSGPEANKRFSTGTSWAVSTVEVSAGGTGYANWYPGEPNNHVLDSHFLHIVPSINGAWNDTTRQSVAGVSSPSFRYVVEYGGMPGDSPTVSPRSKSVTLSAQQTVTTTTTTEAAPIELNDWQFLSGAGKDDAIRLEGIPIWDTAEAAATRNNGAGYAGGAVKVGALSALYQRIMWLSDPANSPLETGNGYDVFSKNAENIDGAPDQQIFNGSGELISALTKSLNELVDGSILQINAHRSYFGAYAGRMEHNIANLAAQSENLTAAGSRIRDTDYGAETASLTRTQILQQAATAMLAQANAMPNVVLALLRQQ